MRQGTVIAIKTSMLTGSLLGFRVKGTNESGGKVGGRFLAGLMATGSILKTASMIQNETKEFLDKLVK